jgi:hypothetical protein
MTIASIASSPNAGAFSEPAIGGDVNAEFAALVVASGQAQRFCCERERDALESFQESEEDREISAMRKKADDAFAQSVCEGVGTIASAGGSSGFWGACGTAGAGTAKIVAAGYAGAGATDDANAAQHRAAAENSGRISNDMQQAAKDATEFVNAAADFYRQSIATEAAARTAALHRA